MKIKHFGLIAIMAAICLICSCCGGSGSSSSDGDGVVKVSFGIDNAEGTFRSASITNPDITSATAGLVYEYNAHAEFNTPDFGTPKGDTGTSWVVFNPYISSENKGTSVTFAQGKWTIQVRVKKNNVVIYQTAKAPTDEGYINDTTKRGKTQYINSTTSIVEIKVEKEFSGTGKITIKDLYAPDTSGSDKLVVTYGLMGSAATTGTTVNFSAADYAEDGAGDWVGYNKYNAEIPDVAAGAYWVTVAYNNGSALVGASTFAAEVIAGEGPTIGGSIQNGIWASSNIKVVGVKKIEATVTVANYTSLTGVISLYKTGADKEPPLPTSLAVTCAATITDLNTGATDTTANYTFCVGGNMTSNDTGEFAFNAASYPPGTYEVYCLAADSTNKISITATPVLKVEVNP